MSEFTAIMQAMIGTTFLLGWISFKLNEDTNKLTKLLSLLFFILTMLSLLATVVGANLIASNAVSYLEVISEPFILVLVILVGLVILLMILRLLWLMKDLVTDFLPKLFNFRGVFDKNGKNRS